MFDSSWTLKSLNSCGWQFLNLKITNSCDEFVWLTVGWSFSISRYTSYTEMVGPSVFPEKQVIPKWLVLQYFQKSGLYQNGWSFSISREAGYTKMVGPSVFPDSQVEKSSFDTQNRLFRTDFKSETTSKYILDIPWVFPAHFPYIKHYFLMKFGQNQLKSRKID